MPDELQYEKKDHIVTLTMNRPEALNAMNFALNQGLADAWKEFKNDDDAWVAIIRGTPDGRAFCSGMDLKERAGQDAAGGKRPEVQGSNSPEEVWKPVIAAIHGYCLAGGWMLAQRCDFRICSDDALLGIREVKRGLMPHWVADLPKLIGLPMALEVVLMGEYIAPQRAYEMGFVNKVVPRDQLYEEAMAMARILIENAPLSVRGLKEVLYRCQFMEHHAAMDIAKHILHRVEVSEDIKEGPRAFAEKRQPQWKGR
jgi:enoyl-CoA hydratase/carnithine racemase